MYRRARSLGLHDRRATQQKTRSPNTQRPERRAQKLAASKADHAKREFIGAPVDQSAQDPTARAIPPCQRLACAGQISGIQAPRGRAYSCPLSRVLGLGPEQRYATLARVGRHIQLRMSAQLVLKQAAWWWSNAAPAPKRMQQTEQMPSDRLIS
jgi:hypothetical protein